MAAPAIKYISDEDVFGVASGYLSDAEVFGAPAKSAYKPYSGKTFSRGADDDAKIVSAKDLLTGEGRLRLLDEFNNAVAQATSPDLNDTKVQEIYKDLFGLMAGAATFIPGLGADLGTVAAAIKTGKRLELSDVPAAAAIIEMPKESFMRLGALMSRNPEVARKAFDEITGKPFSTAAGFAMATPVIKGVKGAIPKPTKPKFRGADITGAVRQAKYPAFTQEGKATAAKGIPEGLTIDELIEQEYITERLGGVKPDDIRFDEPLSGTMADIGREGFPPNKIELGPEINRGEIRTTLSRTPALDILGEELPMGRFRKPLPRSEPQGLPSQLVPANPIIKGGTPGAQLSVYLDRIQELERNYAASDRAGRRALEPQIDELKAEVSRMEESGLTVDEIINKREIETKDIIAPMEPNVRAQADVIRKTIQPPDIAERKAALEEHIGKALTDEEYANYERLFDEAIQSKEPVVPAKGSAKALRRLQERVDDLRDGPEKNEIENALSAYEDALDDPGMRSERTDIWNDVRDAYESYNKQAMAPPKVLGQYKTEAIGKAPTKPSNVMTLTDEWQEVPEGMLVPAGGKIRMNMAGGKTMVRLPDNPSKVSPDYGISQDEAKLVVRGGKGFVSRLATEDEGYIQLPDKADVQRLFNDIDKTVRDYLDKGIPLPAVYSNDVVKRSMLRMGRIDGDGNIVTGSIPTDAVKVSSPSKGGVFSFGRKWLTGAGDLPQYAYESKLNRDNYLKSIDRHLGFSFKNFDSTVQDALGRNLNSNELANVNIALGDKSKIGILPEALRGPIERMRDDIDALSRQLIDIGAAQGNLKITIQNNMGTYVTRAYEAFEKPGGRKLSDVPQDVQNKFAGLLRQEYPDATQEQIKGLMGEILFNAAKGKEGPLEILASRKLGSKDLGVFKHRKDLPVEYREFLGEIKDPKLNYALSMTRMAQIIANHKFMTDVIKAGEGTDFFKELPQGEHKVKIAGKDSESMFFPKDIYTTEEIAAAFSSPPQALPTWLRVWMKLNSASKLAKLPFSSVATTRNFIGNTAFAVANGHWDSLRMPEAIKTAMLDLVNTSDKDYQAKIENFVRLGIMRDASMAGELRASIKDATKTGISPMEALQDRLITKAIRGGVNKVIDFYGSMDDIWKIYGFENEITNQRWMHPDWSSEQIEIQAANYVQNHYPTWSRTSAGVKALRRLPTNAPFVTFFSEVFRVSYNTMKTIARELTSDNPRERIIGAKRAAGVATAATAATAASIYSRNNSGIQANDEDDLRRFMPEWNQNSQLYHLGRDDNGVFRFIDLSYTDPYQMMKRPFVALSSGRPWEEELWQATAELARPIIGEELFTARMLDILRNKRGDTGRTVFNPALSETDKAIAKLKYLYQAYEPGVVTSAKRVAKGASGESSLSAQIEAIAMFTGQRIVAIDIPKNLSFMVGDYNERINNSERILYETIERNDVVSDSDVKIAYVKANEARKLAFDKMSDDIGAAVRLRIKKDEIIRVLQIKGLSKDSIKGLMSGQYIPIGITNEQAKYRLEKASLRGKDYQEAVRRRLNIINEGSRQ